MSKRMLIDASHAEETRVVIVSDRHLEEFECESSTKKPIKGNIYLARVIRVEPSLQAAFVDFGSNRHGFLAFNEIHPDYYKIPVEDQAKLLASLSESSREEDEEAFDEGEESPKTRLKTKALRDYKIQEVIKKRQVMLVQVVKEERGGKGAALTTYLSLPGRYCVLMPNTPRGGGISRKITDGKDRKRLKEIMQSLEVAKGMGVILRTAGMGRTKVEIKRDYDYLVRLWEEVREKTLKSTAPSMIYEEGNLITKAIRDLYTKDVEEVLVEGEESYREAKNLMRLLMPSHAKKVQLYREERLPLFQKFGVEEKIDNIHCATVHLPSGGYLVINTTEALVAIDINSGKATRERHIEETAVKTNLEAADEIARQLRLRDLAGLIVVDFIDMENSRHNTQVERRFRDALKDDRARIQVGSISTFGLLEMSRQRLRPSLSETISMPCSHCRGTGVVRSIESSSLQVLRALEKEGAVGKFAEIVVYLPTMVAFYLLNQKRSHLVAIEAKYALAVSVVRDDALIPPDFKIEHVRLSERPLGELPLVERSGDEAIKASDLRMPEPDADEDDDNTDDTDGDEGEAQANPGGSNGEGVRKKRRRRSRSRGRGEAGSRGNGDLDTGTASPEADAASTEGPQTFKRRRPEESRPSDRGRRSDSNAQGTDPNPREPREPRERVVQGGPALGKVGGDPFHKSAGEAVSPPPSGPDRGRARPPKAGDSQRRGRPSPEGVAARREMDRPAARTEGERTEGPRTLGQISTRLKTREAGARQFGGKRGAAKLSSGKMKRMDDHREAASDGVSPVPGTVSPQPRPSSEGKKPAGPPSRRGRGGGAGRSVATLTPEMEVAPAGPDLADIPLPLEGGVKAAPKSPRRKPAPKTAAKTAVKTEGLPQDGPSNAAPAVAQDGEGAPLDEPAGPRKWWKRILDA